MCAGFDLVINDVRIQSSEILYQSCRFPDHPSLQYEIISESNPMMAKRLTKKYLRLTRDGWDINRVSIMKWVVFSKLCQNWDSFYFLLNSSGDKNIVEHSEKDVFWGANRKEDGFFGANVLGRILMLTRAMARTHGISYFETIPPPRIPNFYLLGSKIRPVQMHDKPRPSIEQLF